MSTILLRLLLACLISAGCFGVSTALPLERVGESSGHIPSSAKSLKRFLLAVRPAPLRASATHPRRASPLVPRSRVLNRVNWPRSGNRVPSTRMTHGSRVGNASEIKMMGEAFNSAFSDANVTRDLGMELLWDITASDKRSTSHDQVRVRRRRGRELPIPQEERYTTSDWRHILAKTPSSVVLKRIRGPIITNMVWAAMVWGVYRFFNLPTQLFPQCHSLIGSALGLLLVFRTNAAYQRFWEGRILWENLLGEARGLSRMSMMYHPDMPKGKSKRIMNLICVFSSLLAEHLGYNSKNRKGFRRLVSKEERRQLERCFNRPLWAVNTLGREVKEIPDLTVNGVPMFTNRERFVMLAHVDNMCKVLGKCERLVQTPVPLNYVRHTSRFLALWLLTLPFALAGGLGGFIVPVMGALTWVLYGIQEIGLMIEDPFRRALHLDVFVRSIFADVVETNKMISMQNKVNQTSHA